MNFFQKDAYLREKEPRPEFFRPPPQPGFSGGGPLLRCFVPGAGGPAKAGTGAGEALSKR